MQEGSRKAIIAAFFANLGIAVSKLVGFLITGSAGLLAEAGHSLADTGNQALLMLGGKRAAQEPNDRHQFGYGNERYFWAFVVALVLFSGGGLFALYEGLQKLLHPHEANKIGVAIGILLAAVALEGWCKTSGSKGMQMYVPLNSPCTHQGAADFALAVGQVLERQHRERVTTVMAKVQRPGKIFVDWSQNARFKTTIGVYSMRARPEPTVSTPVTWDEVEAGAAGAAALKFDYRDVLDRVERLGDLFEPVLTTKQSLPVG